MSDANAILAGAYLLFTITNGGDVSTAGFPTKALCEDGASLALTGLTVAEAREAKAAHDAAVAKRSAAWAKAHPPREPGEGDKYVVEETRKVRQQGGSPHFSFGEGYVTVTPDYKIQDWDRGEYLEGAPYVADDAEKSPSNIKLARCFQNPT